TNAGSSMPRHCFMFVARNRPCFTVTRPCAGGVTRRTAGRGPDVQSLRMVTKIPAFIFVLGAPFTCPSIVALCANASAGSARSKKIDTSVGRLIEKQSSHCRGAQRILTKNYAAHIIQVPLQAFSSVRRVLANGAHLLGPFEAFDDTFRARRSLLQ